MGTTIADPSRRDFSAAKVMVENGCSEDLMHFEGAKYASS
jgi:hypothetical protein